jgi:Holliday junction resolvase
MTNYTRGRAFEYEIVKYFKNLGYLAYRSAGSHSPVDVTAISSDKVYLIQAKVTKRKINPANLSLYDSDLLKLQKLAVHPIVTKQLWVKELRKTVHKFEIIKKGDGNVWIKRFISI